MTDFASLLQPDRGQPARAIHIVTPADFTDWLATQPERIRTTVGAHRLTGKGGDRAILPGDKADDWSMLLVCPDPLDSPWRIASLGASLPEGTYRIAGGRTGAAGLGWMLAQHRFERYVKPEPVGARVLLSDDPASIDDTIRLAAATALVRDLVDTGASDLGPAELEVEADRIARQHQATLTVTRGDAPRDRLSDDPCRRPSCDEGSRAPPNRTRMGRSRASPCRNRRQRRPHSIRVGSISSRALACG